MGECREAMRAAFPRSQKWGLECPSSMLLAPAGRPSERRRDYLDSAERGVAGCGGVDEGLECGFRRIAREGRAALGENDAR